MIRYLIYFGLGYLAYKLLRSWIIGKTSPRADIPQGTGGQIEDVMVKDPYCQVYFPKREGIRAVVDGEELYFCSRECRDKFLASPPSKEKR